MSESVETPSMTTSHQTATAPPEAHLHVQPGQKRGIPGAVWAVLVVIVIALLAPHRLRRALARSGGARPRARDQGRRHPLGLRSPTRSLQRSPRRSPCPGNTQAFTDTPIYARTSGYLKKWYFDIGARVKKGQLMAQIETPELDQQLQVAQADLKSAQANLNLANTTSARYQNLLTSNSVSKQETDQAVSDAAAEAGRSRLL